MGADLLGDADSVASASSAGLARPANRGSWCLTILSDAADLDGLWPSGPAGRGPDHDGRIRRLCPAGTRRWYCPSGCSAPARALSYLMCRLNVDPDQRIGAIDLVEILAASRWRSPQASAVIATSALSCRDYRDYFAHRREQMAEAPAAGRHLDVLCPSRQTGLSPGGGALVHAGAGRAAGRRWGPRRGPPPRWRPANTCRRRRRATGRTGNVPGARCLVLERAGLLTIDTVGRPPTVRMTSVVSVGGPGGDADGMLDRAAVAAADAPAGGWPVATGRRCWP